MNRSIKKGIVGVIFLGVITTTQSVWAKEVPFTQEDRDRLIRMEIKLEEMEKRFEQRFEEIDKRFGDMISFMWILATIFVTITGVAISFALWDRRTMIRPFETKVRAIEEKIEEIEEDKIAVLFDVLRQLAKTDTAVAGVLKRFSIL